MNKLLPFLCASLLLTACSTPVAFLEPTHLSSRSTVAKKAKPIQWVSYTQCSHLFVLLPFSKDPMDLYEEIWKKTKEVGGNAVLDYQVQSTDYFYGLLYGRFCNRAKGLAVQW